ncbi:MAG TPA: hypothetical protein VI542_24540 [Candidatus Tectomicrobia bacterium]
MTAQEASATLLNAVDTLEPLIRQHADEAERHRRLALPVVRALTDAGIFRICVAQVKTAVVGKVLGWPSVTHGLGGSCGSSMCQTPSQRV